jgi:K+-transporting ATPase ATPase C chain
LTAPEQATGRESSVGESPEPTEADRAANAVSDSGLVTSLLPQLRPALLGIVLLSLLTGVVFPLSLALPARLIFPEQSRGSLILQHSSVVGSRLIGQATTRSGDFHPRPSAAGSGYDATASGGTNLGPSNPKLRDGVPDDPATPRSDESFAGARQLADEFRRENGLPAGSSVPIDAVTRSGSGLDPHISPANANLQVVRVARERGLSEEAVRRLIVQHTLGRQLGFLGSPRVPVLDLNLALDQMTTSSPP